MPFSSLFTSAACLPSPAGADVSLHGVAVCAAGILVGSSGKTDLIAVQPTVGDRRGDIARLESSRNHLKILFEREFPLRQLPSTFDLCRHDPEICCAP